MNLTIVEKESKDILLFTSPNNKTKQIWNLINVTLKMEHNISDVHFRIYFFSSSLAVTFVNKKNLPGFIYTFKIFEIKKEIFFPESVSIKYLSVCY